MGLSVTTLHVIGVEREVLVPLLASDDLLRTENTPWLSIVPAYDPDHGGIERLERLAKRLTKEHPEAAALYFDYFDDEIFHCRLYRGGKVAGSCHSRASWAKLGRALNDLFKSDEPAKALRCSARCSGLEEQLCLLEETVGTALLDVPDEEARRVPRSNETVRGIKRREALLRKRPNRYRLAELPRDDWPLYVRAKQELYERLRPEWQRFQANRLQLQIAGTESQVAHHPEEILYRFVDFTSKPEFTEGWVRYHLQTGRVAVVMFPQRSVGSTLWVTHDGAAVCLFTGRVSGRSFAACVADDGEQRWRFVPGIQASKLVHAHTSAEGVITLYSDAAIWQLDGETGCVLRSRTFPGEYEIPDLTFVPALDRFIYCNESEHEIVFLNDALEETGRMPGWRGSRFLRNNLHGTLLCDSFWVSSDLRLLDLLTGACTKLRLEIPTRVESILPDGRILGGNEAGSRLTVFETDGTVAAQLRLKGTLCEILQEPGRVCVTTLEGEQDAFVSPEILDGRTVHVWTLERTETD